MICRTCRHIIDASEHGATLYRCALMPRYDAGGTDSRYVGFNFSCEKWKAKLQEELAL